MRLAASKLRISVFIGKSVQKLNNTPSPLADLRLAQLTEVTGLSPELIRAWERRYGFPTPVRTPGGHRRYSRDQAATLHRAALLIRSGFRAREAISRARQADEPAVPNSLAIEQSAESLADQLIAGGPSDALSQLRTTEHALGFERTLEERVLPALRLVGRGWETGALSVAQEHTATGIVISWLGSVRSELRAPRPPVQVLIATPPGEHHAVPVWAMELLLTRRGVSALALGSDVPIEALVRELRARRPQALVLSVARADSVQMLRRAVAIAAEAGVRVFAGGPGLPLQLPAVEVLPATMTAAADRLAAFAAEQPPRGGA